MNIFILLLSWKIQQKCSKSMPSFLTSSDPPPLISCHFFLTRDRKFSYLIAANLFHDIALLGYIWLNCQASNNWIENITTHSNTKDGLYHGKVWCYYNKAWYSIVFVEFWKNELNTIFHVYYIFKLRGNKAQELWPKRYKIKQ